MSTFKNADIIFVVDNGQIVESGAHDELMSMGDIYHKLLRIQTKLAAVKS